MTDRTGAVTTTGYDALGRISRMTDPTGVASSFQYDSLDRLVGMTRGGATWQTGYDAEGVVSSRTTPLGYRTAFTTDALGHVTQKTDACGRSASFVRDALSRLTAATDGLGRTNNFAYNATGMLSSVTLPETGSLAVEYDAMGMLAGLTDRNGNTWPFTRSKSGRMASAATPEGYVQSYGYDSLGRVASVTGSDRQSVSFTRDAAGNVIQKSYSDGTVFTYTYDALNRLTATEGLSLTRDAEGLVEGTSTWEKTFGAVYDAAGRLVSATYDSGLTVNYSYSETTGLLVSVSDTLTGSSIDFEYDQDRRLTGITRSNGVNGIYSYNNAGRLVGIQEGSIIDLSYTLDDASQVTAVDMTVPLDPAEALGFRTRYYAYDNACRPGSAGHSSDTAGRTTASPTHSFKWRAKSLLTGVDETDLSYNGMGDLLSRSKGGASTRYHYNYGIGLHPIVAEEDGVTGAITRYYVWSPLGELLYSIDAGTQPAVRFYHFDLTGSTLALTDEAGQVTDAYAYTPYGRVLAHQGERLQPFTYAGRWGVRQEGTEGDLFHARARYYDARNARFLSPEPLFPQEPDLHMLSPYLYAHANPVSMVDVTGFAPTMVMTPGELLHAHEQYEEAKIWLNQYAGMAQIIHSDILKKLKGTNDEEMDIVMALWRIMDCHKQVEANQRILKKFAFMGKREMQQKAVRVAARIKKLRAKIRDAKAGLASAQGNARNVLEARQEVERAIRIRQVFVQKMRLRLPFPEKQNLPSLARLIKENEAEIRRLREPLETFEAQRRDYTQQLQQAELALRAMGIYN